MFDGSTLSRARVKAAGALTFCRDHAAAMSVLVIVLGFMVATLLLLIVGKQPLTMYQAILQAVTGFDSRRGSWNPRYVGEWITMSVPLILCGLSVSFAFRTGLFNIGAEGQYIMGLTVAQFFAFTLPATPVVNVAVAAIAGAAAGALWGGLVGWLKGKYRVSEVVSTIMLNYVALFFSRRFTVSMIAGTNTYRTPDFPAAAMLTNNLFNRLTNHSLLNNGVFIVLGCLVLYYILMEKTSFGLSLKATGLSEQTARFSGMPTLRNAFAAMAFAGAFAGLAGAIVALGSFNYGRVLAGMDQYGFNGIAVALVAGGGALGNLFAGLLFGMLSAAQPLMQSRGIPKEIASIISGLVVVFISLKLGLQILLARGASALSKGDK